MRILVTGGAGYVGSACLRYLLQNGHQALAFDDLSKGHREAVPEGLLRVGRIHDTELLTRTMRDFGAEAVMHFAAATDVGESVSVPDRHYDNNIVGTLSVLRSMQAAGVRRLLFSSTCATYGDNPVSPMSEAAAQIPCSPYARTKLAVEWMIADFSRAYGLGYTLLRYFNAAGADPDGGHGEDHEPELHLIPILLQVAAGRRDRIKIFGDDYPTPDGTCIRDYVHTADLASAHLLAIQATTRDTAEVFNVGTGTGHSVLQVHRACEEVSARKIPYDVVARRPGDAPALVADPSKLKQRLGWMPRFLDIKSVIQTAWNWHGAYPHGYARPPMAAATPK